MARRIYRSRDDRILGGVAAGVAEYFDVDPTIVRLAWLLTVLWGGTGLLLYIFAWIIVPLEPEGNSFSAAASETMRGGPGGRGGYGAYRRSDVGRERAAVGWVLVGIGFLIVLFGTNVLAWLFHPSVMLAVLFFVTGLFFLGRKERPPRVR